MSELLVPTRFRGPARSGNGGWSAGALAALAPWATVTVRLSAPPPLETPMTVDEEDGALVAAYVGPGGATEVLRASEATTEPTPAPYVDLAAAREAEGRYPGLQGHPFPTCFVCGTGRDAGDGLRIFAGPVRDGVSAATWTPTEATPEQVWAAMDCPGAWAADVGERMMVLGTMTARVDRLPVVGEEHVVVGEVREVKGRRSMTAATLYDAAGGLVGTAEHVWVAVDPAIFN
jgi:hypothetical protein